MPIAREFHDWQRPALAAAAQWLIGRYDTGQRVDMDRVVVVVPGSRAGRRLREVLLARLDQLQVAFFPPSIVTIGQLPELLYRPKRRFASELTQQLAWARALSQSERSRVQQVIRVLPAQDDHDDPRWIELGGILRGHHRELAADGLDFVQVAQQGTQLQQFDESHRWEVLAEIQNRYLQILDRLELWDRQTARLEAIRRRECALDGDLVLLGTVDMNQTLRRMLDQVADRVTALVHAPPEWADRFDRYGCLDPPAWQQLPIRLQTEQIRLVDGPMDQVEEVVRVIASYGGAYRADQVTVGVPDESLVPHLERLLPEYGIPARWGPGRPVAESGPYRLLKAVAAWLQTGAYSDFAALVRHPAVVQWLGRSGHRGGWLTELDGYYAQHLPARLDGPWLGPTGRCREIRRIQQRVQSLVQPLSGEARHPGQWAGELSGLLLEIYQQEAWDLDDPPQRQIVVACQQLHQALASLADIPDPIAPRISAAATIHLALGQLQSAVIASESSEQAVELLGWLELPLDDAPGLVVTSFHEGIVPKSVNADLFLPNALRSRLGLDDNARRFARDAYSLSVLLASRPNLSLIVARRDQQGDPVLPSRLLFATDQQTIAPRALSLFSQRSAEVRRPVAASAGRAPRPYATPRPLPLASPIERLSPTQFRTYLACPYRFYLQHVLRLETADDRARELDGAAFGTLLHTVLRDFGRSDEASSRDALPIAARLDALLDEHSRQRFGTLPVAAVLVQLEQLRLRLRAFAQQQADWCAKGWRIQHTEAPGQALDIDLMADGKAPLLSGRIDRIDVHDATGDVAILDYKSSDSGDKPDRVHRRGGQWVDLQLPLYRHLARGMGLTGPLRLGFVLLPRDTGKTGFAIAEWTEAELAEADEVARRVVREVRDQRFWPPADPPTRWSDPFAAICQTGVFGREGDHAP